MGQKEMGAGRQQGWDTKAKTHELRGGQMGTGEETAGGTPGGKGLRHRAAVDTGGRAGPDPCGSPHSPPVLPCPPLSPQVPSSPVGPPGPFGCSQLRSPPRSPPGCSSPGASQHLLLLPWAARAGGRRWPCPPCSSPAAPGPGAPPGRGSRVQGCGQPLAGAAGPRSAQ